MGRVENFCTRRPLVENLAEDADYVFSVVSYIRKITFYTAVFTRTKRPWLWTATLSPWTWANDAKRNFIYRQLHKYRPSY